MLSPSYPAPNNVFPHISGLIDLCNDTPSRETVIEEQLLEVSNSNEIVSKMTLKEKIGQKIILDFRYWQENNQKNNKQDMVLLTETIKKIIMDNHIGGVILFANNLKSKAQIQKLTDDLRKITPAEGIPLFIATDNEGGSVFRLPRSEFSSFPGNMALGAAFEGTGESKMAYCQGCIIARDLLSLGINTNFAPVMDVNSNQDNPVINIRSFGDNPATVGLLGRETIAGINSKNVVSVAKHFPGHGDTVTDSHVGLPVVSKNLRNAHDIDLAPYRDAIRSDNAPDMIMTAHIQYPALDDTRIKTRGGEDIILPATLSKKIQTDLLRGKLGFKGVTITDALDMKAISDNFDIHTIMEEVFKAGVDIALMPVRIYSPGDAHKLESIIKTLSKKITANIINEHIVTTSVRRIIDLKREKIITIPFPRVDHDDMTLSKTLEKYITDNSITLLKNSERLIPLKNRSQIIFILTPLSEQSAAINHTLEENGYLSVQRGDLTGMNWLQQQKNILVCDTVIIGSMSDRARAGENNPNARRSTDPAPFDESAVQRAISYAKRVKKKVIYLSLKTPYDVINYDHKADAVLATYSFYGVDNHNPRGLSLNAATEVIIGKVPPRGKLPVNIYNVDDRGHAAELKYPRGFGLTE